MPIQSISPQTQILTKPKVTKKERYPWHAVASFMLPGTGQFIKGEKRKGKIDLGVYIGCVVSSTILGVSSLRNPMVYKKSIPEFKWKSVGALGIIGIISIVNRIQSTVDAYKSRAVKKPLS